MAKPNTLLAEYQREVAVSPDYSLKELFRLPLLKVMPPAEASIKQPDSARPGYFSTAVEIYNAQNRLKYAVPTPLQLLADHVKPGQSSLAPTLDELLNLPRLGLEQRITLELTKLPNDYIAASKIASSGESMLGSNPNPSVMSYRDTLKPYTPRTHSN
jgi:hypothetical protein